MPYTNAQARDLNNLFHPYTNLKLLEETGPLIIERGQGVRVYDTAGKDYIEAMSGLWCTALGWGDNELAETAAEQMRKLSYGHVCAGKSLEPAAALAEKLKEIAPFPVGKVLYGCSGSEANDTQIKFAWYASNAAGQPKKKKIISRKLAYHGITLAAASLTGIPTNHISFDEPLGFALHTDTPHYYRGAEPGESEKDFSARLAANLNALIEKEGPDTIAAMIVEPVMGAGGAIVPPEGYFDAITQVLTRHDIRLISDEVITGFGRTGEWFGAAKYGFEPDSMSLAKALSSAYLPISAVLLSPEWTELIDRESRRIGVLGHGYTYGGHPVTSAVALKTIEIYERRDIMGHVRHVSQLFLKRIAALEDHPLVGEAKGVGLIAGIELVADKKTKTRFPADRMVATMVMRVAEREGLIIRAVPTDRIALCPPLIISEDEINDLFDRLTRALDATADWAKREKLF
ncbi:MAG TPA: aminotransferase [Rhizomicrobium sp.]|jgi:4-aminobutyrate--pyruvate transaminase|nr:aminotransferase [Rhizomicrobium sp.]